MPHRLIIRTPGANPCQVLEQRHALQAFNQSKLLSSIVYKGPLMTRITVMLCPSNKGKHCRL